MNERHTAYVCMGSNMGEPETNLASAREALAALPGWKIEAASPVYLTEPQNVREQAWFANQVLKVSCASDMTAPDFLDMLLDVEKRLGRVRDTPENPVVRFGPRVIDLDLLLFDRERRDTAHLTLPHPRMLERAFVLVPLRDIEPNLLLSDGRTPGEVLRSLAHAVEGNRIRQ
ncbi:2-amino-4-hydroxy-6-hydroxymethyldihydropteridine diphosphokinase [uncultured Bilophila sp.]|uniref:2-amino-4-hydroxy-6- hydroxymethyldihydropteridine diphosphokinase n=1 Tax=uncultured Bilophila sp. TaxID=529385 RepID=UPI0026DB347D|nr:2-amino-4-hydroxy-6-hydroxymethyldihydropteridine diphosphokinase [uncultured Bilophila sp.]